MFCVTERQIDKGFKVPLVRLSIQRDVCKGERPEYERVDNTDVFRHYCATEAEAERVEARLLAE